MIATTTHTTEMNGMRLHERNTVVALGRNGWGLAFSYRRPAHVAHDGTITPIRDVTMAARVVMLGALLLALAMRRMSP